MAGRNDDDEPKTIADTITSLDRRSALYALRCVHAAPKRTADEVGISPRVLQFLTKRGMLRANESRGGRVTYRLSELGAQWMSAHGGPFT